MTEMNFNNLKVSCFDWDFIASHMYVIKELDEALIIDPVDTEEVRKYIVSEHIRSCIVLLTHEHYDHISGVNLLKSLCRCNVICSRACADNIRNSSRNHSDKSDVIRLFNSTVSERRIEPFVCEADSCFDDCLKFKWHNHDIYIFDTPGHSAGSVCILFDGEYMFSGDTLLDVLTITRLPGGNRTIFKNISLSKLRKLRFQVKHVFPGHGVPGTLDELLKKYDD